MTTRKLRILFAGTRWPLESFLIQLVQKLCDHGHRLTVASSSAPSKELLNHVNFLWLPTPVWKLKFGFGILRILILAIKNLIFSPARFFLLLKYLKHVSIPEEKIRQANRLFPYLSGEWDLIYFPWNSAAIELEFLFELPAATIISCRGSQVMVAPHNPTRSHLKNGLERTFKKADLIHCVSESIRNESLKYGLNIEKSRIIRPAVNTELFSNSHTNPIQKHLKIISVGNLNWVKGFEYALEAISMLVEKKIPLEYTIIGSGNDLERILFNIQDHKLTDFVKCPGAMLHGDIVNHLIESDIFLLSSLSEGISNAALEAMACGNIVVSTECGGMSELINHNENGILVPVRDPVKIAEEIENIWQNPEMKVSLGVSASKTITESFNIENQINDIEEMYTEAVNRHKAEK